VRHIHPLKAAVSERLTADFQFPEAPCGGLGAPDTTVTPLSHSSYAQTGKQRPDARVQRDSNATLAWNIRDVPGVTGNVSEQTATSQILYRTTNNAASPAPRDLCAGDERPARRLSDACSHPGIEPGSPGAGGAGTVAGPIGVGDAPGQREALSAYHNWYLCDACPLEWDEYAAFEGEAWCPGCDRPTPAYASFDLSEGADAE